MASIPELTRLLAAGTPRPRHGPPAARRGEGRRATDSRPAARSPRPPDHHARSHRHLDPPL